MSLPGPQPLPAAPAAPAAGAAADGSTADAALVIWLDHQAGPGIGNPGCAAFAAQLLSRTTSMVVKVFVQETYDGGASSMRTPIGKLHTALLAA